MEAQHFFKHAAMIFGIAVLFALLVGLTADAILQEPKYDDYCPPDRFSYPRSVPTTLPNTCTYDSMNESKCFREGGTPIWKYDEKGCQIFDKCDLCSKEYDNARKNYERNTFFMATPVGLIAIVVGIYWPVEFIGTGFMFGGVLASIYGTVRYFAGMSKFVRVIVILIELCVLIFIGYKKLVNRPEVRSSKKKH